MYNIQPKTLFIGKNTIYLPTCHSTNDIATELLQNSHEIEGTIVITDFQSAGRGQRGNTWYTQAGQNFTFSIILKPNFIFANEQFWLNIAISLGIFDFLNPYIGNSLKIKWPNDIYVSNQKLGGILIENTIQNSKLQYSVIGIGMNINQIDFETINATSLGKVTSQNYSLQDLLPLLLEKIEKRYLQLRARNYAALKFDYLQNLWGYQIKNQFLTDDGLVEGVILGISETGKLILNINEKLKAFGFQEVKFLIGN